MSSHNTTCCGTMHQTFFCPRCRQLNPELDCDTLVSIAKQCMERASVLALQKPVIPHSVNPTHNLQSMNNDRSSIVSTDSVAQNPLSASSNPPKPGSLRQYATRLFSSSPFAKEDLPEERHAQSFEQQTKDFFPTQSSGTDSLLETPDVPRTSKLEAPLHKTATHEPEISPFAKPAAFGQMPIFGQSPRVTCEIPIGSPFRTMQPAPSGSSNIQSTGETPSTPNVGQGKSFFGSDASVEEVPVDESKPRTQPPKQKVASGKVATVEDHPEQPEKPPVVPQQQSTASKPVTAPATQPELRFTMPKAASSVPPTPAVPKTSDEDINPFLLFRPFQPLPPVDEGLNLGRKAASSVPPMSAITKASDEDVNPFLLFRPFQPLPPVDHGLSFGRKTGQKRGVTDASISGKLKERGTAFPATQSSLGATPSFFDTPEDPKDQPSPRLSTTIGQRVAPKAITGLKPGSAIGQPFHAGQAPTERQLVRPTGSLSGGLEPLQGQLYSLRPKVWHGLTCHSCPQDMQAAKMNQHPNGFCKKKETDDTRDYFEVLLHAVSKPDVSSRCQTCIAAGNGRASENHTKAEHGMARWYDHPDNSPIPDVWILFYNPCPGLENEKSKHNARSDIPPLHLLKKHCNRSARRQMLADWKLEYETALKSLNPNANPDVAVISHRYGRWQKEMYRKNPQKGAMTSVRVATSDEMVANIQAEAKELRKKPDENKKTTTIPSSDYQDSQEDLPSEAYRDYMFNFLSENEKVLAINLIEQHKSQAFCMTDPSFKDKEKRAARIKIASDLMTIYIPQESKVFDIEMEVINRRKAQAPCTGPKTDRSQWLRKYFCLATAFAPKETIGYPDPYESRYGPTIRQKTAQKLGKTVEVINGSELEEDEIIPRSAVFHIQDYPVFEVDCAIHVMDWANATVKECAQFIKFTSWLDSESENCISELLSPLKEDSEERTGVLEICRQYHSSSKLCVDALVTTLATLAESRRQERPVKKEKPAVKENKPSEKEEKPSEQGEKPYVKAQDPAFEPEDSLYKGKEQPNKAKKPSVDKKKKKQLSSSNEVADGIFVSKVTFPEFTAFISEVQSAFVKYNSTFDETLKAFAEQVSIKPLLESALTVIGKRQSAAELFLGRNFPAESEVRAVIPRLAWPLDFVEKVDDGEDDISWAARSAAIRK